MAATFPDNYVHLGGDEVRQFPVQASSFPHWFFFLTLQTHFSHFAKLVYGCWNNNSQILDYMNRNHMTTKDLFAKFEKSVSQMVLANNKTLVVWQDVFDYGVISSVPPNTIVQVWESGNNIMQSVVNAGYKALLSAGWYLNQQVRTVEWVVVFFFPPCLKIFFLCRFQTPTSTMASILILGLTFT